MSYHELSDVACSLILLGSFLRCHIWTFFRSVNSISLVTGAEDLALQQDLSLCVICSGLEGLMVSMDGFHPSRTKPSLGMGQRMTSHGMERGSKFWADLATSVLKNWMKLRHLLVGFIDEFVPWMSCDMIERTRKAKVQAIFKSLWQRLEVHQNVQCTFIGIIILASLYQRAA